MQSSYYWRRVFALFSFIPRGCRSLAVRTQNRFKMAASEDESADRLNLWLDKVSLRGFPNYTVEMKGGVMNLSATFFWCRA